MQDISLIENTNQNTNQDVIVTCITNWDPLWASFFVLVVGSWIMLHARYLRWV